MICTRLGKPINPENVKRNFDRIVKATVLQDGSLLPADVTPHGLRHTCASLMLKAGIHPKVVSEKLGHEDVQTTLNIYSHLLPNMQADAASVMNAMFTDVLLSVESE